MKKLLMISVLMSMALGLSASHPNASELIISLHDGAAFNITIGERTFNHQRTSYAINGLRPGRHFVEIVRFDRFFNGRFYVLGAPRVVFSGYIRIPARTRLVGQIDRRQRFVETERMAMGFGQAPGHVNYHPAYGGSHFPVAMSPAAFSHLKATLASIPFDSSRLDLAKHAIASNNVLSWQVRELMGMFSFESSRLELAKFAFANTIDPQNYFMVHSAFSFSSSTRELNRFIARSY